jgi:hypothetical protein
MEIAALAAFLAPALQFLMRGAESAADEAAQRLGSAAWEHAQRLWAKLKDHLTDEPLAQAGAEDAARHPGDPAGVTALELGLQRLLDSDPALRAEIEALWKDTEAAVPGAAIASGDGAIAVSGTAKGFFNTGDNVTKGS